MTAKPECVAIYNWVQIDLFFQLGLKAVGCKRNKTNQKIAILFEDSPEFREALRKWQNHELEHLKRRD